MIIYCSSKSDNVQNAGYEIIYDVIIKTPLPFTFFAKLWDTLESCVS